MRVETFYFDAQGNRVSARDGVTGEVRQYDEDGKLVLTVHLESVDEESRRRWYQVRALGRAPKSGGSESARVTGAESVIVAEGLAARPTAEAG